MAQTEWQLGQTSARYESNGNPGLISSGENDHGGVSYGTYQFSTQPNGGAIKDFLRDSAYKEQFKGLEPTKPEFNAKWKELAKSDPRGFAQDQYNVMKKTHYDPMVATLKAEGIDLSGRGPAVQDALWSTSTQFGPNHKKHGGGGPDIYEKSLQEKFGKGFALSKLSDVEIISAVQDYKIEHNKTLFASSPKWQDSLGNRAKHEKTDLLKLASEKIVTRESGAARPSLTAEKMSSVLKQGAQGQAVHDLQANLAQLGYTDHQHKPLPADGDFGLDTRHAVERFQHDHHLTVDGVAGPKTLEAIHHAQAKHVAPSLADPNNPDHVLYEQARGCAQARRRHGPHLRSAKRPTGCLSGGRSQAQRHDIDRRRCNQRGRLARLRRAGPAGFATAADRYCAHGRGREHTHRQEQRCRCSGSIRNRRSSGWKRRISNWFSWCRCKRKCKRGCRPHRRYLARHSFTTH